MFPKNGQLVRHPLPSLLDMAALPVVQRLKCTAAASCWQGTLGPCSRRLPHTYAYAPARLPSLHGPSEQGQDILPPVTAQTSGSAFTSGLFVTSRTLSRVIVPCASSSSSMQAALEPLQEGQQVDAGPAASDVPQTLTRMQLSSKVERGADRPEGLKRTVAMHVGYVGTAFRGLQKMENGTSSHDETVEGVLETAIFKAGLISESNYGSLGKVKWSRNSRTDKGVHSLATVIGLRILIDNDDLYVNDPEGLFLAARINAQLPATIRVFAVQRVNKKYNSRRQCIQRTYEYYLPAYWLGIGPPGPSVDAALESLKRMQSGVGKEEEGEAVSPGTAHGQATSAAEAKPAGSMSAEGAGSMQQGVHVLQPALVLTAAEQATIASFRQALSMYTGRHPFHNYTVRKMYLTNSSSDRAERRVRLAAKDRERAEREQLEKQHDKQDGQEQDGLEGINDGQDSYAAGASAAAGQQPEPEGAGRGLDGEVEEAGEVSKAGGGGMSTGGGKRARKRAARAARDSDVLLEEDEESDGIGHGEVAEDEEALFALAAVFEGQGAAGSEVQQSQGQYDNIQNTRVWLQSCGWKSDLDERDRVIGRHYRSIAHFTADDPRPLVPGGVPCLRLEVCGESFMLHQIRHMIGGAVAAARGMVPLELLQASLSAPARVTMPRAPPHTLFLSACTFLPWRKAGELEASVTKYSGESLCLREGGAANLATFRNETFDAALNSSLAHPEWALHSHQLAWFVWPQEQQQQVFAEHAHWLEEARQARIVREAERAAALEQRASEQAAALVQAAAAEPAGFGLFSH